MKCGAAILVETRKKKGSGQEYERVRFLTSGYWLRRYRSQHPDAVQTDWIKGKPWIVCDGEIEADVAVVDEPYYGGTSASLEVNYKCKKCGNGHFPELPSSYTISEFLTKYVARQKSPWETYDSAYGDNRTCSCGHEYHAHFHKKGLSAGEGAGCAFCRCEVFTPTQET